MGGLTISFYVFIILGFSFVALKNFKAVPFGLEVLFNSVRQVLYAILAAIPVATTLTVFLVKNNDHRINNWALLVIQFLRGTPFLASGILLVFWLQNFSIEIQLFWILLVLSVPSIVSRWHALLLGQQNLVLEAGFAIGMNFWQTLYFIHFKHNGLQYLRSLFSVAGLLLGTTAPFLLFIKASEELSYASLEILRSLLSSTEIEPAIWGLAFTLFWVPFIFTFWQSINNINEEAYGEVCS